MEHAINTIAGILAAVAQQKATENFHDEALGYGISGLVSFAFIFALNKIINSIRHTYVFDWRFKATGLWIETVSHYVGRQYTISKISYNSSRNEFQIVGDTFTDDKLDIFSSWRSMAMNFPESDSLYYLYTLENFKEGPKNVIGLAHMSFFANTGSVRKFFDGKGYFLDKTSEAKEVEYTFERINRHLLLKTIRKSRISSKQDRENFLREYSRLDRSRQQLSDNDGNPKSPPYRG
jgi:hypothetical protein